MSGKELLDGLNDIDDRFIEEAENQMLPAKRIPFRIPAGVAACAAVLMLVAASVFPMIGQTTNGMKPPQQGRPSMENHNSGTNSEPEGTVPEVPHVVLMVQMRSDKEIVGIVVESTDSTDFLSGMMVRLDTGSGQIEVLEPGTLVVEPTSESDRAFGLYPVQYVTIQLLTDEEGAVTGQIVTEPRKGE